LPKRAPNAAELKKWLTETARTWGPKRPKTRMSGAPPGDGPVEAVEPLPRLVAGHEPRDVHHHAAAAQVRHLPPRRLRPLRLSLSFPLRLSGDAGFRDGA